MSQDKQLRGVKLKSVLEKCRLDQALNAKAFAVRAGISYTTAREWFQLSGFPRVQGVVFWQDFVQWRKWQIPSKNYPRSLAIPDGLSNPVGASRVVNSTFPPRAAKILDQAGA
jgi:hypothetical protein